MERRAASRRGLPLGGAGLVAADVAVQVLRVGQPTACLEPPRRVELRDATLAQPTRVGDASAAKHRTHLEPFEGLCTRRGWRPVVGNGIGDETVWNPSDPEPT